MNKTGESFNLCNVHMVDLGFLKCSVDFFSVQVQISQGRVEDRLGILSVEWMGLVSGHCSQNLFLTRYNFE